MRNSLGERAFSAGKRAIERLYGLFRIHLRLPSFLIQGREQFIDRVDDRLRANRAAGNIRVHGDDGLSMPPVTQ